MEWFRKLITRAALIFGHRDADQEMAEEIRLHQAERVAELEAEGVPSRDARRQASREFGNTLLIIEDSRSAWHLGWIEDLLTDLRYGMRGLSRDRAFALTAIISLALGIGVNTVIFSLAGEFLFSEASVREPSRILNVRLAGNSHADPEELRGLRDAGIFDGLAGFKESELNWRKGDTSRRLFGLAVTPNFFPVLGVPMQSGRGIQTGDKDVAVISHRFWNSALLAHPNIVGHELILEGRRHTVIGILPPNHRTVFGFSLSPDLYVLADESKERLSLYGRLPDGVTKAEATSRIFTAAAELDRVHPSPHYKRVDRIDIAGLYGLEILSSKNMRPFAAFFGMLMIVVSLVLLIACTNVASLLLARASARTHELAVRASIGASRSRIVRQLLAEALLLSVVGAAGGIALNRVLSGFLNRLSFPLPAPIVLHIETDWRLLIYSAVITVISAVLAGLLPALQASRFSGPSSLLNQSSRQTGGGSRMRSILVAGQVAVTFVVLTTAFLFLRNLASASEISPGFEINRLVWASMRLVPERYPSVETISSISNEGLERLKGLPGVESATLLRIVPFNDQETHGGRIQGEGAESATQVQRVYNRVSPGYFRTMGIRMIAGQEFEEADLKPAAATVVINEALARRIWNTKDAVGKTIKFPDNRQVRVIGVAANTKFMTIGEDDKPAKYEPYRVTSGDKQVRVEWMIRTRTPATMTKAIEKTLLELDPAAAMEVRPMENAMGLALLPSQVGAGLMGMIGTLGLTLASIGLYGVLVYGVARRRREIGVRVALGAQSRDVLGLVLRDGAWILFSGMAIGLGIALLVTRPLAMFLVPGLEPSDPWNYGIVVMVLSAVALVASMRPAIGALRVNPTEALRNE